MSERRIADLFRVGHRFQRSVQLERDFNDPEALGGYVLTDFAKTCLTRVAEAAKPNSGRRAWRVTGDYGSGKSSFALLLAHLFGASKNLPARLKKDLVSSKENSAFSGLTPVLCTCSRKPLTESILEALRKTVSELYRGSRLSRETQNMLELLTKKAPVNDSDLIDLLNTVNTKIIADHKSKGMLLVLDELGKFLEYAAMNQSHHDVFLLQQIAEFASRSGTRPLMVICLLHQGFSAYSELLSFHSQREWEKVAGRFEEIVFNHPVEQITHLMAAALNVQTEQIPKGYATEIRNAMTRIHGLRWFGSTKVKAMEGLAERLFPLHPSVLPVLMRIFRRYGQNERSLFSFLLGNEPFGLQEFSDSNLKGSTFYCLHNLYDYVRTVFGNVIASQSYRNHWNLIESVIETYATADQLQVHILKTIGILNLLNDDLIATEDSILASFPAESGKLSRGVKEALHAIRNTKRVIYDRGRTRGFCLWPHTSVDIEQTYQQASAAIQTVSKVSSQIGGYLEASPIVARRHYIETGNLRHFEVRYCSVSDLQTLPETANDSDGVIIVPLCETKQDRSEAIQFANSSKSKTVQNQLFAIPNPLSGMSNLLREVLRWDWVAANTPELSADKFAREEVSRQQTLHRQHLEAAIQTCIGLKSFNGPSTLEWYHQGKQLHVQSARNLLEILSNLCDKVFPLAPHIQNELVNRSNLSSAAAAARMRLIEGMFARGNVQVLGMDPTKKPPEMSMYLSVLKNAGIHQQIKGNWCITIPDKQRDKVCQVTPALQRIADLVRAQPDSRVGIVAIWNDLKKPPYGVRAGLFPILLTTFAIANLNDIAFYKDGTFIREMTGEIMLELTKAPEKFEIQYCRIEGVRAELFEQLARALDLDPQGEHQAELLAIVKPLCVFVAQLPPYVHQTKKLSEIGIAIRDAILQAREPAKLLFTDLPQACGMKPFPATTTATKQVQPFVRAVKSALDELRGAFLELQDRLRKEFQAAFSSPSGTFSEFRTQLSERSERVLIGVTEPKLRAFCLRLLDDNLPESEWLESMGSLLALKPPTRWSDQEESLFVSELAQIAQRFHRVETVVFSAGKAAKGSIGVRVAVTQATGVECERVIHYKPDEIHQLSQLQSQFETLLKQDKRLGLAAASRAIWAQLDKGAKPADE